MTQATVLSVNDTLKHLGYIRSPQLLAGQDCKHSYLHNAGKVMDDAGGIKEGFRFNGPTKTLTDAHFIFFSGLSGDVGRVHYDAEYAKRTQFGKPLAHGLLLVSLTALGASNWKDKPEGFIFVEQGCKFLRPAVVGDTVRPEFVIEKVWNEGHRKFCRIKTAVINQRDEVLLEGFQLYRIIPPKASA